MARHSGFKERASRCGGRGGRRKKPVEIEPSKGTNRWQDAHGNWWDMDDDGALGLLEHEATTESASPDPHARLQQSVSYHHLPNRRKPARQAGADALATPRQRESSAFSLPPSRGTTSPSPHPPRKKRQKQIVRRPEQPGRPWSATPGEWEALSWGMQRRLSHVGRIEETRAGELAEEPCGSCVEKGFDCRQYTEDARRVFNLRAGFACAACQLLCFKCSFVPAIDTRRALVEEGRGAHEAEEERTIGGMRNAGGAGEAEKKGKRKKKKKNGQRHVDSSIVEVIEQCTSNDSTTKDKADETGNVDETLRLEEENARLEARIAALEKNQRLNARLAELEAGRAA